MVADEIDPAQAMMAKLSNKRKPIFELISQGNSPIQQFYSGAKVFMTGGSGFLGKQFIEKMLRATKVSTIFVLLRPKKGKTMEERLQEMLQDSVFDVVREQEKAFAERIVAVPGDVAELRLGISDKDWDILIKQVDIIVHMAATTRFDEALRLATLINIRGTREALFLGKACKNLRSFVYVSTAFTHACEDRVDTKVMEEFYPSPIDPNAMITIAETVEEERLNNITDNLIKKWPNTYTFAKAVAEDMVRTFGEDLPLCVVRPAIVVSSKLEPSPGWLDMSCIYGASGLVIASGLGLMHTIYVNDEVRIELVPVDYVNNAIIAAGYETAKKHSVGEKKTKIYTVNSSRTNPVIWRQLYGFVKCSRNYSSPKCVSYANCYCTDNRILFWFLSWVFHIIPAYIFDGISVVLGKERRFVKLSTKMYRMSMALSYFLKYNWLFDDTNTKSLYKSLSATDQKIFNFNIKDIVWQEYMTTWLLGLRQYIVKDGLKGSVAAERKQGVFLLITLIILPIYFYCLYKILYFAIICSCLFFKLFW